MRDDDDVKALVLKLSRGRYHYYHKEGFSLTPEECNVLWEILVGERKLPRRRGPKADPELPLRDDAIATLVSLYEADGEPLKAAIAKVCDAYGVSRSQVFAARRQHPRTKATYDPVHLVKLIHLYERMWSKSK